MLQCSTGRPCTYVHIGITKWTQQTMKMNQESWEGRVEKVLGTG